jgi:PBP1b-binding outer membrane lipoprotein LpoB
MKYSLFIAALLALFLVGCMAEKEGQYPPSLYEDESGDRLGAPSGQK